MENESKLFQWNVFSLEPVRFCPTQWTEGSDLAGKMERSWEKDKKGGGGYTSGKLQE